MQRRPLQPLLWMKRWHDTTAAATATATSTDATADELVVAAVAVIPPPVKPANADAAALAAITASAGLPWQPGAECSGDRRLTFSREAVSAALIRRRFCR